MGGYSSSVPSAFFKLIEDVKQLILHKFFFVCLRIHGGLSLCQEKFYLIGIYLCLYAWDFAMLADTAWVKAKQNLLEVVIVVRLVFH